MTIQSERNLYPGINPHLNSFFQQPDGGWESFHTQHIVNIGNLMDAMLPRPYYAVTEKSLQIGAYVPDEEIEKLIKTSRTIPDISIYKHGASSNAPEASVISTPTMAIPVTETFADEESLTAVVIYRLRDGKAPGNPITRLELLSPGNKPNGHHYLNYLTKRQESLKSGLRLVEIDYLHESRPVLHQIPSYPDRQENAFPYTIIVSDPRPTLNEGLTLVYGIKIDEALPKINIPLAGSDVLTFDFGVAYATSFQSQKLFSMLVDYEQEPVNFDRYHPRDQAYIRSRMQEIAAEFANL